MRLNNGSPKNVSTISRLFLITFASIILIDASHAYTSNDPKVLAMVERGLKTLEKGVNAKTAYPVDKFYSGGAGEHALAGYAYYKVTHDHDSPVVKQGLSGALRFVRSATGRDPGGHNSKTVYAAAVVTLLLAEVDPDKYRNELKRLEKYFRAAQYRDGGYGYVGEPLGDISQTQYAMLALWTLDHVGIIIDYKGVAKTINWLLRVQDPSGGWPYMGKIPRGGQREKQQTVRLTMAYAGGSAILIAADILKLWGDNNESTNIASMPRAVALFKETGRENENVTRPKVPAEPILSAIKDCQSYIRGHAKEKVGYPFYNIYTIERYESFRELAFKLEKNKPAPWYDSGIGMLSAGSGWKAPSRAVTESTATAFALLFLIRSTQKAIEQASAGSMAGGQGLPKKTTNITVQGTKIKGESVSGAVDDLLKSLEDDGAGSTEGKSIPDDLKLATNPKERQAQLDRLERLVRGSRSWQARRVAAKLLGASDEMRVVPSLIFALSDQDTSVRRYARDGLRFISRKFEGFGMPDKPSDGQLDIAQRSWRKWYLSTNPTYVFLTE